MKTQPLTPVEVQRLLKACQGTDIIAQRDYAAVILALGSGLRRSALVKVAAVIERPSWVYLGVQATSIHPLNWAQTLPYRQALQALLQKDHIGFLFRSFSQPRAIDNQRTVGKRLTADGLYKALSLRADQAGLSNFNLRQLRLTHQSWCAALPPTCSLEDVWRVISETLEFKGNP